ncbi:MAG: HAD family phosphatase [Methylacidiphilales bacterium]|nr:HAD family phosphatase [Candidatus Methylacidiphilales bacterium]
MPGAYSSKRHFLFDLDGTLVDSSAAHARAFVAALTPGGPALAKSFDYSRYAGRSTREVFLALGVRDEPELTELVRSKQQHYRAALERGDVELFAGTALLLERLRQKRSRLFLVTSASRVSTERVLELKELGHFFEGITTAEDVGFGKPSPELFLYTVARHGLEKQDCLVVEDGESGIAAARSAGLDAVLIHTKLELPGVPNVRDCKTFAALLFP